jgi:hypothetical protein
VVELSLRVVGGRVHVEGSGMDGPWTCFILTRYDELPKTLTPLDFATAGGEKKIWGSKKLVGGGVKIFTGTTRNAKHE